MLPWGRWPPPGGACTDPARSLEVWPVNTIEDFMTLVRVETGLLVEPADADRQFDDLPGWDSVHLLQLLTMLEQTTGRQLSLPEVLAAPTLAQVYALATTP
jgi:acyl carrier protein